MIKDKYKNDFISQNTLIGSNLYISPMNNNDIGDSRQKSTGNISSSFSPIVKL